MSTSVTREEWPTLREVPRANYKSFSETDSKYCCFGCDVDPEHGLARVLMQTEDHRAIALCKGCLELVKAVQS